MGNKASTFSSQFRFAAPYIQAHRGKTFVVGLPGDAVESDNFQNLVHDLALLSCLGIKLVLVHGARPQIERALETSGQNSQIVNQVRVTPENQLQTICNAIHQVQESILKAFSRGLPHTPSFGMQTPILTGNFIAARPLGVKDGVDYQYTGQVRQVHAGRIDAALDSGAIVVISTLGYSLTGEIFNLSISEVTSSVTESIGADKLICFSSSEKLDALHAEEESVFNVLQLEHAVADQPDADALVQCAVEAISTGLPRAHIVDFETEGAVLEELFTPQGSGLMIVERDVEKVRVATLDDVGGILDITQPFEAGGQLVQRDRDLLEQQIDCFRVIDIDGMIVASAALFHYSEEKSGELAGLAIHPDFQNGGRGAKLVHHIEHWAQTMDIESLFSLTTEGAHWFISQGFEEVQISDLPKARQELYDDKRASKILKKSLVSN